MKIFAAYTVTKKEDEKNRVDCDIDSPPQNGKVCRVDVSANTFGLCTKDKDYGYSKSSPCIFLKLNKVSFLTLKVVLFILKAFSR